MTFSTDSHFVIGNSHLNQGMPCQDYAASGTVEDSAFGIVSDGCSTGGRTDVGARLVALATERELIYQIRHGKMSISNLQFSRQIVMDRICFELGLVTEDLLATCVYSYLSPTGGYVIVEGDGCVALKYRDGKVTMYRYSWMGNVPFYPARLMDVKNVDRFIADHGGDPKANRLVCQRSGSLLPEAVSETRYTLTQGIDGAKLSLPREELEKLDFVAIFSDGVEQFGDQSGSQTWQSIICDLLSFKNTTGEFVKRRLRAQVKIKKPQDDVSLAVIKVNHGDDQG